MPDVSAEQVEVEVGDPWAVCAFRGTFRRYQTLALDAVDRQREAGSRRAYVVMPPGSGKTVLGLEVARRIGRRTLVLTPNTAVQGQWLRQWEDFAPAGREHPLPGSADRSLERELTVLTYQALSVWDSSPDDEDVEDDTSAGTAARRRAALRGDPGSELLDLLHPNGRDLVARARRLGPWTLVLDECHHLLETWGALVRAVARALGADTWVVGLTATPASQMTAAQRALHDDLFGDCDFSVPTPAVVKEGELAPYQELVYLTAPTPDEDTWLTAERTRFADLQVELLATREGTVPFAEWLRVRLEERSTGEGGAQLEWRDLERAEPELARAALRMVGTGLVRLPAGARLREEHRVEPDAADWAVVLGAYAAEHLVPSRDPGDERLLAAIRRVLPGLGWQLTVRGLRATTSPVDRVCALSTAKAAATVHVLDVEREALKDDLRAVVLCDLERRAARPATLLTQNPGPDDQAGSARLVAQVLAASDLGPVLRPVLVTGRTVAVRREDVADLRAWLPRRYATALRTAPLDGDDALLALTAKDVGWTPRVWTPLMTRWFEQGGTRVLVGTRALLGEGWDCPAVNVVVDLSSAATPTAVTQLRGRSLRLDPDRPDKVADNWTVITVADGHPRGDADHLRAARKHAAHLAPDADGEVTTGLGHCDEALSPYAPPPPEERAAVNARALARAGQRTAAREAWRIGEPYRGVELEAVQVQARRPLGLPGRAVPAPLAVPRRTLGTDEPSTLERTGRRASLWPVPSAAGVVAAGMSAGATESVAAGAGGGLGVAGLVGAALVGQRYRSALRRLRVSPEDGSTASLGQLARAVADALKGAGGSPVGAEAVTVRAGRDGWLVVELDGPATALFATSLDELLAPLAEPRWLVSRLVHDAPAAETDRKRLARRVALSRTVEASVAWHAVPTWLGRNQSRVAAFDRAWQEHVGAGRLVAAGSPEGLALLDLLRGADPFAVTSRLRTTWR